MIDRIRRKPLENAGYRRLAIRNWLKAGTEQALTRATLAAGAAVLLMSASGAFALSSSLSMQSSSFMQSMATSSFVQSTPAALSMQVPPTSLFVQSTPSPAPDSQSGAPNGSAQQPDSATTGALLPVSVTTNVNNAELFIDGHKRDEVQSGAREWKVKLAEGTHDVRVAKDKYQSASMDVEVKQNYETEVQLTLLPTQMQLRPLPRNDSDEIKDLLERRWKRAFESGNLQEVRAIWPNIPVATENAIMSAKGITLNLSCSPLTTNDMAIARCSQVAKFNGKNASGVVVFKVRKTGQAWEINGSM